MAVVDSEEVVAINVTVLTVSGVPVVHSFDLSGLEGAALQERLIEVVKPWKEAFREGHPSVTMRSCVPRGFYRVEGVVSVMFDLVGSENCEEGLKGPMGLLRDDLIA